MAFGGGGRLIGHDVKVAVGCGRKGYVHIDKSVGRRAVEINVSILGAVALYLGHSVEYHQIFARFKGIV